MIKGNDDIRTDIPRVTQILKAAGIIDDRFFAPGSAERGSDIHLLTQLVDQHQIEAKDFVDSPYEGWMLAYFKFLHDLKPKMIETELEVHYKDKYEYIGHIDRVMQIKNFIYIVDYKTGKAQESAGYQLAAYVLGYLKQYKRQYLPLIIEFSNNGKYRLRKKLKHPLDDIFYMIEWKQALRSYYEKGNVESS